VTGAQIPLSQLRNDAVDNLLGALVIAGHYIIPGRHPSRIARLS
jgi:lysophospholipase